MAIFRLGFALAGILLGIYVYCYLKRVMKFYGLGIKKIVLWILTAALTVVIVLGCRNLWSFRAVVILHMVAIAVFLDLAAAIGRCFLGKWKESTAGKACRKLYGCGLLPVLMTGAVLSYGYFNMQHAVKTEYDLATEKGIGNYRIVLLTDIHYGTIQSTNVLKDKVAEISGQRPDIVVLGGDIVEEGTSREQMQEVFRVLGGIEARYGIYYVFGNHDRQPYTRSRSYTNEELEAAIRENGIRILEDEYVEINDELILAGRGDAAWGNVSGRASVEELLEDADTDKYIIVADHQPIEAEENSAQGVDLLISGHTHAGQVWPVGILSELTGILNYGEYDVGSCKVVVSSGFTGWGYPVRTEEHCEYVLINIAGGGDFQSGTEGESG